MSSVDVALVVTAGSSVPLFGLAVYKRWRYWNRWRDDRARREFIIALLWLICAGATFVASFVVRVIGAAAQDPLRVGALAAVYAVMFVSAVVLLVEWDSR